MTGNVDDSVIEKTPVVSSLLAAKESRPIAFAAVLMHYATSAGLKRSATSAAMVRRPLTSAAIHKISSLKQKI